jgi:thiol-disulfide isomerase/thioredoxin
MMYRLLWMLLALSMGAGLWWFGGALGVRSSAESVAFIPQPFPQLPQLQSVHERAVLLTTWASWCAVCMSELPAKIAYANQHPQLALVAVNIDATEAAHQAGRSRLNSPARRNIVWLADPSRTLAFGILQGTGVPESYVLNAQRHLLLKHHGPVNLQHGAIAAALKQALAP